MTGAEMSLLTHPPHGTYSLPCCSLELLFTVMPVVSTALKENNEKSHLKVCLVCRVVSILTAGRAAVQTVFVPLWTLKVRGAAAAGLDLITESTMGLHYQDYRNFVKAMRNKMLLEKGLPNLMGFFQMDDGYWEWYGVRVIRPGSAQVLLCTTKHQRGVLQWKDRDGGHLLLIDLHPLDRAPHSGVARRPE